MNGLGLGLGLGWAAVAVAIADRIHNHEFVILDSGLS